MRRFVTEIFNEFVDQTQVRYSSAHLYNTLGEAEKLVVQFRASKVSGTSPTLTAWLEHSNDGKDWQSAVTLLSNWSLSSITNVTIANSGTTTFGALIRLVVGLGGTTPSANISVWACGRSEELDT